MEERKRVGKIFNIDNFQRKIQYLLANIIKIIIGRRGGPLV